LRSRKEDVGCKEVLGHLNKGVRTTPQVRLQVDDEAAFR
jgi:hypothetical protein